MEAENKNGELLVFYRKVCTIWKFLRIEITGLEWKDKSVWKRAFFANVKI